MTTELGDRIKRLRLASDLTLKEVGEKAGVSPTHLSEIERGKTSPTVGALLRIAAALGEEASRLVDESCPPAVVVTREGERREWVEKGAALQPLTGGVGPRELSVVHVVLAPGATIAPLAVAGEQLILVLEGAVDVVLQGVLRNLREGDAVHCASADCRGVRNGGEHTARVVCVCSPAATI
jgi:transcriptional regulator with XRE-family HTH domain